mgnify:CR=1 FL=1
MCSSDLSEFALGTISAPGHFPKRNRIIAGMSRAVLVVEAALNSGSLITARLALEQGREVLAIPGSIHSPLSKGCHALIKQGAKLVVDGRDFKLQGYENGFFVGPTLFDNVTPDMEIYKQEIFGPVLSTVRTGSYEEALKLVMDSEYGNGTAIYTADGDTARDFASRVNVGMVGINFPIPVPLSYFSFGGWKKSAFGDLNQYGPDAFKFYTKTKTVTARWFSGIKDGAALNFKALD